MRSVSLAARCLWLECMCVMHRAEPYGHLVVNGRPVTDTQLAILAGAPPDLVPALKAELETAGVFSRNRAGVIYSRRMTRDEKRSNDGRNAKINGGKQPRSRRSQAVEKLGGNITTLEVDGKVSERRPSPQIPESRIDSPKPPRAEKPPDPIEEEFDKFWSVYPRHDAKQPALKAYRIARREMSAEVLLASARGYAAARSGQDQKFTALAATWLNNRRWSDESIAAAVAKPPAEDADRAQWRTRLKGWSERRLWLSWGPRPDEPGCHAPPDLLREFGIVVKVPA